MTATPPEATEIAAATLLPEPMVQDSRRPLNSTELITATVKGQDEITPVCSSYASKGESVHLYEDQVDEQAGGEPIGAHRLVECFARHRLHCDACAATTGALQAAWAASVKGT